MYSSVNLQNREIKFCGPLWSKVPNTGRVVEIVNVLNIVLGKGSIKNLDKHQN